MSGLVLACMILAASFFWWHSHLRKDPSRRRLLHQQVTFVGDAYMPAISPDAMFIAYVTRQPGTGEKLMIQSLSGGPSVELLRGSAVWSPTWSPDGSELLVFASLAAC